MRLQHSTRIQRRPVAPPQLADLPESLHPVVRRVLAARGAGVPDPGLAALLPVSSLPGVMQAAERLLDARVRGERVVVIGDFDADGATATALTLDCLRAFGFAAPACVVPDRLLHGYGLTPPVVDLAVALQPQPQVLLTVDNGITSLAGVARARELGLAVLITDHHLPGPELPAGALLVNPNLAGGTFGSRALCGAGVAFYLMAALGRTLAARGLISAEQARAPVLRGLDLVALATVADMVPLDANNRILVREGLRLIRAGRARPGIAALFAVAGREMSRAGADDLAFGIAPRVNAAGRLTDMTLGIECLLADDTARAREHAARLDALNRERRALQAQMQDEAGALLDVPDDEAAGQAACLFDPSWHPGVVGLVATRIKERTRLPAVALARAGDPGWLRGSARSIPGVHVRDCIAAALGALPNSTARCGGHAMAAGLSLPEADLPAFRMAFAAEVAARCVGLPASDTVWTDGELCAEHFTVDMAAALEAAGPWGQGCAEPLFDNRFEVTGHRVVRGGHLQLALELPDGGARMSAIAFGREPREIPERGPVRLVYRLGLDAYRAHRQVQLVVEHVECV
jgi:single-stranded-DNA-specific exonuclease